MIIHNIVPNRERLFSKFNMVPNHDCVQCGELHDNVHLFCACQLVREGWFWVRQRLLNLQPNTSANTSNFEFINLMFECAALENEVIWMLGIWVQLVWDFVICKKKMLKLATVQSEFSLKFVSHQNSNLPPLAHIIGLQIGLITSSLLDNLLKVQCEIQYKKEIDKQISSKNELFPCTLINICN